jgi:cysteine desulfurase/selenocysteine lyase
LCSRENSVTTIKGWKDRSVITKLPVAVVMILATFVTGCYTYTEAPGARGKVFDSKTGTPLRGALITRKSVTGVLYGTSAMLESMPPYQSGGDMIRSVSFEHTVYDAPPYRFEAGTPNIAGAVGLAAAMDYLTGIGFDRIARFERELLEYATGALSRLPGVRVIGAAVERAGVISFVLDGVHPHDVGTVLDREGVAIRTGHHCAQPLMDRLGIPATARASFAMYNRDEDVDVLVAAVRRARALLG